MREDELTVGEIYHSGDKGMPRQSPVMAVELGRLWHSLVEKGRVVNLVPAAPEVEFANQVNGSLGEKSTGLLAVSRRFGRRNDDRQAAVLAQLRALDLPELPDDPKVAAKAVAAWQEELMADGLMLIAANALIWSPWTDHATS